MSYPVPVTGLVMISCLLPLKALPKRVYSTLQGKNFLEEEQIFLRADSWEQILQDFTLTEKGGKM